MASWTPWPRCPGWHNIRYSLSPGHGYHFLENLEYVQRVARHQVRSCPGVARSLSRPPAFILGCLISLLGACLGLDGGRAGQHCRLSIWMVKTNKIQVITKSVSDSKIKINTLILKQGALSRLSTPSLDFHFLLNSPDQVWFLLVSSVRSSLRAIINSCNKQRNNAVKLPGMHENISGQQCSLEIDADINALQQCMNNTILH